VSPYVSDLADCSDVSTDTCCSAAAALDTGKPCLDAVGSRPVFADIACLAVIESSLPFQSNHGFRAEIDDQSSAVANGGIAATVVDHAAVMERA
jgi:hypothetical protein